MELGYWWYVFALSEVTRGRMHLNEFQLSCVYLGLILIQAYCSH